MLFSYGYGQWWNQQWHQNVLPLRPILKALRMRQCYAEFIPQYSMSRATLEASGCRHWATTCSLLPRWLPGQQQTKQQWKHAPTLLAILMAVVVRWYNTTWISWWRGSRASLEATGCHHWASTAANSSNQSCIRYFFFSLSTSQTQKWGVLN